MTTTKVTNRSRYVLMIDPKDHETHVTRATPETGPSFADIDTEITKRWAKTKTGKGLIASGLVVLEEGKKAPPPAPKVDKDLANKPFASLPAKVAVQQVSALNDLDTLAAMMAEEERPTVLKAIGNRMDAVREELAEAS